jgi:HrpA-like RNA helicase
MCYEMGYKLGQEIGYCVRFEEKRSAKTKIIFMTDGMAIRELMTGRTFDIFILDEAHERSINTDVLMALLRSQLKSKSKTNLNKNEKNSKKSKSSDFKVVIMSATI